MDARIFEKFVDEYVAAEFLGLSVCTLRNRRHMRRKPDFRKFGRSVKYSMDDLQDYADSKRVITDDTTY